MTPVECRRRDIQRLDGRQAQDYAAAHLEETQIDVVAWTKRYRCAQTGAEWLMDYPHSEAHGGGPPRLTRITEIN